VLAACLALALNPTTPNVLLIVLDDAGYGDFGFTGHPTIRTPRLDALATQSVRNPQFYVSSPACTASRYSILTGRHPRRSGFGTWVLGPESKPHLDPQEQTLPEAFRAAGYRTALFGKWHLGFPNAANGHTPQALPLAHGFDEWFGIPYSNDMRGGSYPPLLWIESTPGGTEPVPGYRVYQRDPDNRLYTSALTDRALAFMRRPGAPWLAAVFHPMPHVPLTPHPRWAGTSRRGPYGDVMEELDAEIGRLVEEAERQNTIIVFTSDNGPWILKGLEGGSSGLFTDGKGSTWEGGIRVPMLMRWRGHLTPGVHGTPWATVDLLPTLTQMALGRAAGATDGQAVDLAGVSTGVSAGQERLLLFHGPDNTVTAARWGRWKLHLRLLSQVGGKYTADEPPLLYDLEVDPSESRNVAAQHPDVVAQMRAMVAEQSR